MNNFKLDTDQVKEVYQYLKLKAKLKINLTKIWFNKECLRLKLTPKYAILKNKQKTSAAIKTIKQSQILRIKNEIQDLYGIINNINKTLLEKYFHLSKFLIPSQFDEYINLYGEEYIEKKVKNKTRPLKTKLEKLKNNSKKEVLKNEYEFAPRTVNLSQIKFNKDEEEILNKGNKFNTTEILNKQKLEELAVNCEQIIQRTKNQNKDEIRTKIGNAILELKQRAQKIKKIDVQTKKFDQRTKKLNQKIKDNNLILTKADKGNTTVIMNKNEYINKVEKFVNENGYIELKHDPTNKYQAVLKRTLNENKMFEKTRNYIIEMNPTAPTLKGLIKLHKQDKPIRPLINFIGAPTYKISKLLTKYLNENYNFEQKYNIKNSKELTSKLGNIKINSNDKLISLDVTNMFGNIPKQELMEILKNNNFGNDPFKDKYLKLIDTAIEQNYCRFNNKYYKSTKGLAMGSPMSPILAEIYMNHFETKLLKNSKHKDKIKFWNRYVDDILLIWTGTERQLDKFIIEINNINDDIKFTEEKGNKEINYLDLKIKINQLNKLHFEIYRKPTHTDIVIPNDSYHHHKHKLAAFQNYCFRANNILINEKDKKQEFEIIKNIAKNNGYQTELIDKIINKQKKANHKMKEDNNYLGAIPYIGNQTNKITKIFKKHNINIGIKNAPPLITKISNNNTETKDKINSSGVYKINCEGCDMVYIGETGRKFATRIKEHEKAMKNKDEKSLFGQHANDENHPNEELKDKFKIIKIEKDTQKRKLFEQLEIIKQRKKPNTLINAVTSFESEKLLKLIA